MVGSINAMGKKERLSQLVILEGSPTRTDRRIPKECTQQGDSSPLAQNDSRFDGIYASLCHPRGSNKPSARSRTDRRISQSPLHPRDSSHPLRMTMRRHNDSIITNRHVLFKASIPCCHPRGSVSDRRIFLNTFPFFYGILQSLLDVATGL